MLRTPKLQVEIIDCSFNVTEGYPAVLNLSYNLDSLQIQYQVNNEDVYLITFNQPIGFRVLDEGDLSSYWKQNVTKGGQLFKVIAGGWADLEASTGGFLTYFTEDYHEYLLTSPDDCVSVFVPKNSLPQIEKLQTTQAIPHTY